MNFKLRTVKRYIDLLETNVSVSFISIQYLLNKSCT